MSWEAWFTLIVLVVVLVLLVRETMPPSAAITGGMVAVLVAGIVTPQQALSGFSNPAPITVAALYVLARAVEKTGALTPLVRFALGENPSTRRSLARMVFPTSLVSAFLNNTPVVAMLIPDVTAWAEKRGRSPSLYLMPLSFAALLGGVVTVIGTSTNIVVSGLLTQAGAEPFGFFELGRVGLPIAVGGSILLVALAPRLLKARRTVREELEEEARKFVVDMTVDAGGPLDGQAVEKAGLRHLRTTFLATLERDGDLIAPVAPDTSLQGGDHLQFVGKAGDVMDLLNIRGLSSSATPHLLDLDTDRARYYEVVVGTQSPLVGRTLKEVGFRGLYQAVVLAIHRAGQRVDDKLGQVTLRVGDTLLVLADAEFRSRWRDRTDFLMISGGLGTPPVAPRKALMVAAVAASIVVSASLGVPILHASLIGALVLIGIGVLTPGEARSAVDLEVILVIASAFGLAAAMDASGLAAVVSRGLVEVSQGLGEIGVLLVLIVTTVALTGMITNNAAALLMFPVALSTATTTGLDIRPLAVAITVAASVDFLTPIGYQTNTMVYGPGGYRFFDYARLGAPLTVFVIAVLVLGIPLAWPL